MPGEIYPSLFGAQGSSTVNPLDMLTPGPSPSLTGVTTAADLAVLSTLSAAVLPPPPPREPTAEEKAAAEKKPVKKRKSWGQVLPEPKTNLPPRYAFCLFLKRKEDFKGGPVS